MSDRKPDSESTDAVFAAVGARVAFLRDKGGLTPALLASRAGMDANYLWRVERGRQNLSLRNAARLAAALEVTLSHLFEGVDVSEVDLGSRPYGRDAAAPRTAGRARSDEG